MVDDKSRRIGTRGHVGSSQNTGHRPRLATEEEAAWFRSMSPDSRPIRLDYSRTKGKPFDGSEPEWMIKYRDGKDSKPITINKVLPDTVITGHKPHYSLPPFTTGGAGYIGFLSVNK